MACKGAECKGGEKGGDGCAYDVCVVVIVRGMGMCEIDVRLCGAGGRVESGIGSCVPGMSFEGFGNRCVICTSVVCMGVKSDRGMKEKEGDVVIAVMVWVRAVMGVLVEVGRWEVEAVAVVECQFGWLVEWVGVRKVEVEAFRPPLHP